MRRRTAAMLAVALCAAVAHAGQGAAKWFKHESAEGRYSVLMPKEPMLETQDADGSSGEKFKQYLATATDDKSLYMIGYFDYAADTSFSFDKARDGMVSAVNGTIMAESSISIGGRPGRELKISAKDPAGDEFYIRARYYDVGRRVYVVQYIFRKADEGPAVTENGTKFFDSFQVVSQP